LNTNQLRDYDEQGQQLLWPNIRKPQCPDGYQSPTCLAEKAVDSVLYTEGDLYIVGVVPVHNIGDTPLQCGKIKQGGVDIVESMRYAVDQVESAADNELKAKIGLIIIDSCNDPQIIQERILTLHRLGVFVNGEFKSVTDKILGYVGGWSSDVSIALAYLTSRLNQVQISYASTSAELSRRTTYPYFLRVPSADNKQTETIAQIIAALKGNFIQVVYSQSQYGEGGRDLMRVLADNSSYRFCIANEIPVGGEVTAEDVILELRKEPGARFVVMFIGSFDVENLIEGLNDGLTPNEFLFIASEGWGKRQKTEKYQNLLGTITVTSELTTEDAFNRYLGTLSADGTNADPWIREYMEGYYSCYYEWSYDKLMGTPCR